MLLQEHGNRFIVLKIRIYLFTSQQDIVDKGYVGASDNSVSVHIACSYIGVIIAEQVVIDGSDIGSSDFAIAVHVTKHCGECCADYRSSHFAQLIPISCHWSQNRAEYPKTLQRL